MATTSYTVDYSDKRFADVEAAKKDAIDKSNAMYDGMIGQSDKFYQDQIDAVDKNAERQTELQNQQTDFAIKQIEQQKGYAEKDYIKEQAGAYADWQKQSNQYGVEAEKQAAMGMGGTGYSESSQVRMYTAYQSRVATAREAFIRASQEYDNAITNARLQNNSILAEIAASALERKLEIGFQGFQYKNTLLLAKADKQTELDNIYYARWKDRLDQINTENAMAEQARQFNEQMALERDKFAYQKDKDAKEASIAKTATTKSYKSDNSNYATKDGKATVKSDGSKQGDLKAAGYNYEPTKGFTGSTYEQANAYLEKNGVSDYNLMTKSEWSRRKSSYANSGIGGYEVSANGTYADYLKTATAHAISNK